MGFRFKEPNTASSDNKFLKICLGIVIRLKQLNSSYKHYLSNM